MPKISPATVGALESKELTTAAFRIGRHEERRIDFFPCQEKVKSILSFRARTAVKLQESGLKMPTELDQATAEISKLLREGKNLNDLSPQQIAQAYFSIREIDDNKQHEYWTWVVESYSGKKRNRVLQKERKVLKRTLGDFERRLVGRDYGKTMESFLCNLKGEVLTRDILILQRLIGSEEATGKEIEKARADFCGQEIIRILEQSGEEISEDRIDVAKKSANPSERKFATAAERIPELSEKGMKKRREIAAWTRTDELRQFISREITETELSNHELILFTVQNNPDLLPVTKFQTYEALKKGLSRKTPDQLKRMADGLTACLVQEHSFNSVVDTAIHIIDSKLPEIEPEVEPVETAPIPKLELTAEAVGKAGEPEIALLIAEGKTEQEIISMGLDLDKIKAVRRKYFSKDAAGQYRLKEADEDGNVQQEKTKKELQIKQRYQAEMENSIDEVAKTTAIEDWLKLQRGQLDKPAELKYEDEVWRIAKMLLSKTNARGQKIPLEDKDRLQRFPSILTSSGGELSKIQKYWLDEQTRKYMSNQVEAGWREKEETGKAAWQQLITKKPEIAEEYDYMVTKITASELAQLKPETIVLLKGRGKISSSSYDKVTEEIGLDHMPELLDLDTGRLKPKQKIAQELAKKEGIPLSTWAFLIVLGLMGLSEATTSLINEKRQEDANQLQGLLGA